LDAEDAFDWETRVEEVRAIDDARVLAVTPTIIRTRSGVSLEQRMGAVVTVREGKVMRTELYPSPEEALEAAGLHEFLPPVVVSCVGNLAGLAQLDFWMHEPNRFVEPFDRAAVDITQGLQIVLARHRLRQISGLALFVRSGQKRTLSDCQVRLAPTRIMAIQAVPLL
jgi:hypothetical protein